MSISVTQRPGRNFITALILSAFLACPASGDSLLWFSDTGNWDTDANWQNADINLPGAEPTAADFADIFSGTVTVDMTGELAAGLTVGSTPALPAAVLVEAGGMLSTGFGRVEAGGLVTVTGPGSTWTNTGDLELGRFGSGTLNVEAGGAVSNSTGAIGSEVLSSGTATVTGANSTWTNTTQLLVGQLSNGTLNIEDGGTVSSVFSVIGGLNDVAGTATVTGPGSTWDTGSLAVGFRGIGTLTVQDGATAISTATMIGQRPGSMSTATVTGTGSTWDTGSLIVGEEGSGSLNIEVGGAVSSSDTIIGQFEFATGTATVTGSTWTNSGVLTVGDTGTGALTIEAGGAVSNTFGIIGNYFDSTGMVTVTGAGSTWTNSDILSVGVWGTGTLDITDGGAVSSLSGRIGDTFSGTSSTVTVNGAGSTWTNAEDLFVGYEGTGTLNIEAGATVSNASANIGFLPLTTGFVTVTGPGSTWTTSGSLSIGTVFFNPDVTYSEGTLNVSDGGLVSVSDEILIEEFSSVTLNDGTIIASTINNSYGGTFDFLDGTLSVDSFLGTLDQDGGSLDPGSSPGITTISGDYNLNAGEITIELGGLSPDTEHDQVIVTGALNLGLTSVLDVSLINGFTPSAGDSFDVLDWGSISGVFDHYRLASPGNGLDWDTSNLLIDGTLSVVSIALPGDLDGDGFVGIDDLNIVLGAWNQNVPPADPLADLSGDGFVGIDDLNTVLGNWNAGTPPPPINTQANIPEPGTVIVLIGCAGLLSQSRRRN